MYSLVFLLPAPEETAELFSRYKSKASTSKGGSGRRTLLHTYVATDPSSGTMMHLERWFNVMEEIKKNKKKREKDNKWDKQTPSHQGTEPAIGRRRTWPRLGRRSKGYHRRSRASRTPARSCRSAPLPLKERGRFQCARVGFVKYKHAEYLRCIS